MPDKTAVTASVPESEKTLGESHSREGESALHKDLEKKIREQLRGEYSRKESELSEQLEQSEARWKELDEKVRLTEAEKKEKERLENRTDDLENQIRILETDPQFRVYNEKIKREAAKAKAEAIKEVRESIYSEFVDDFIEEHAEELKMTPKEIRQELNDLVKGKHGTMNPMKRTKAVMKEFKAMRARAEKEAEAKRKADEDSRFSEGNGRGAREKTLEEAKKDGDIYGQLKVLGVAQ